MPRIQGTAVAKFDSGPPITLQGEWNVDVGIPAYYAYGQGDGTEGSGYIGGDIGTKQDVAGGFNFVVDKSGEIIKDTIRRGLFGFFTLDWPIGDPAIGQPGLRLQRHAGAGQRLVVRSAGGAGAARLRCRRGPGRPRGRSRSVPCAGTGPA